MIRPDIRVHASWSMSLVQSTELRFSRRLGSSCEVKIEGIARLNRAELHCSSSISKSDVDYGYRIATR